MRGKTKPERLYWVYRAMLKRCGVIRGASDKHLKRYKERGISICSEWLSWPVFKEWALSSGYKEGLTLDRVDNNGNYEPSNCHWVTQKRNNRNMGTTFKVRCEDLETGAVAVFPSAADAADFTGIPKSSILQYCKGRIPMSEKYKWSKETV